MIPLLLFHLRVGVRVALRASPPLFCGIVAVILFQDPPGAAVTSLARALFARRWTLGSVIPIAAIAFLLSAWGRQRLAEGQHGWIRHLPVSRRSHRAGMFLALVTVQIPLFITLALLAWTAKRLGLSIAAPTVRFSLVCVTAALCHLSNRPRRAASWRRSRAFVNWHITWRALGWRSLSALLSGATCIGISWLFVVNNSLTGPIAAAADSVGRSGRLRVLFVIAVAADRDSTAALATGTVVPLVGDTTHRGRQLLRRAVRSAVGSADGISRSWSRFYGCNSRAAAVGSLR